MSDPILTEMTRMRGFIRAAETQALKVEALRTAELAAPPGPDPVPSEPPPDPVEPPPDPVVVPPLGTLRRNLPTGWTVVSDYGFSDAPPPHVDRSGSGMIYDGAPLGDGWRIGSWGTAGGGAYLASDLSEILSAPHVLEQRYPAGSGGAGADAVRDVPASDRLYLSWIVKWDADFEHHGSSEKWIYFNPGASDYFLFQLHWGSESIYNLRPDPNEPRQAQVSGGDNSLRANQMPSGSNGLPYAPPIDGEWCEYELLFDRSTGTVKWWLNGVLRAHHTGRLFPQVGKVKLATTWGGNGVLSRTCSRYTGHVTLAVG